MDKNELRNILFDTMGKKYNELLDKILNNLNDYYLYSNGEISTFQEKIDSIGPEFLKDLKSGNYHNCIIIDLVTKQNIEKNNTKIYHGRAKEVIILNSFLGDHVTLINDRIVVVDSSVENCSLTGPILIESGHHRESSIAVICHLENAMTYKSTVIDTCKLEDSTFVNTNVLISGGVWTEKFTTIGPNSTVLPGTYQNHCPFQFQLSEKSSEGIIKLNEKAWLGSNVSVVSGVEIGKWSIVSACSVIKKNIKDYSLFINDTEKSIIERFYKRKDKLKNIVKKMLFFRNTIGDFIHKPRIYDYAKDKLRDSENSEEYMKLYYLYVHSNLLQKETKDYLGNSENLRADEYLLEFFSPKNIEINTKDNYINYEFNKIDDENYKEVIKIISNEICSNLGELLPTSDYTFKIRIDEEHKRMLDFIDEQFDEGIEKYNEGLL